MKKLTAILLILVLLINFCGYRFVIGVMQSNTEAALEKKVDAREYSDDELISIKTVLNLPYYTSSAEFERTYGSITIDGHDYEYVMRRVYHDTLEVRCLPNQATTTLQSISNELTKAAADGSASTPIKKGASVLKISLPDFCQSFSIPAFSFSVSEKKLFKPFLSTCVVPGFKLRQEQPPQVC